MMWSRAATGLVLATFVYLGVLRELTQTWRSSLNYDNEAVGELQDWLHRRLSLNSDLPSQLLVLIDAQDLSVCVNYAPHWRSVIAEAARLSVEVSFLAIGNPIDQRNMITRLHEQRVHAKILLNMEHSILAGADPGLIAELKAQTPVEVLIDVKSRRALVTPSRTPSGQRLRVFPSDDLAEFLHSPSSP